MNPSCLESVYSPKCQKWLRQVYMQCTRLLSDKEWEFWDDWWLNRPAQMLLSYQIPHLMTSDDCQKLKKNIAQDLTAANLAPEMNPVADIVPGELWQVILLLGVVILALFIIVTMVYLLNNTLRGYEQDHISRISRKSQPRSIISFTRPGKKLLRHGPYRCRKVVVRSNC